MNDQHQIKLGLAFLRGEVTECDPAKLKGALATLAKAYSQIAEDHNVGA